MKLEDIYMLGRPHGPIPVEKRLTVKTKGEAPKCKTCLYFKNDRVCLSPMAMACPRYERKKKKR